MTAAWDPWDPVFRRDPYPTYARLRAEAPAYWDPGNRLWGISRHADVVAFEKDPVRFCSSEGSRPGMSAQSRISLQAKTVSPAKSGATWRPALIAAMWNALPSPLKLSARASEITCPP